MSDRTALYRYFNKDGALLYVGISLSAVARLAQHKHGSHWSSEIANVTIEYYPTRLTALAAETTAIRDERPLHNIAQANAEKQQPFKLTRDFLKVQFARVARAENDNRTEEEARRIAAGEPKFKLLTMGEILARADEEDPPLYRTQRIWAKLAAQALTLEMWNDIIWECADEVEFQGDVIGFFAHLFSGLKLADGEVIWA